MQDWWGKGERTILSYLTELFPCWRWLLLSADNLCNFGPRSGPTECQFWSEFKQFYTLFKYSWKNFLKKGSIEFWKFSRCHKSMKSYPACKELNSSCKHYGPFTLYSKTFVNRHSQKDQKLVFKTQLSLNTGQNYCWGAFCNTFNLH